MSQFGGHFPRVWLEGNAMTASTRTPAHRPRRHAAHSERRYREFAPGGVIGRFRVAREIGRGGTLVVYHGVDTLLGRDVALKAIAVPDSEDGSIRPARREAQLLSRVTDPNVVRLYDLVDGADADVLVMELVSGLTLESLCRRGNLSTAQVSMIGTQLARGLDALHSAGIVHGDIKPSNLRFTSSGVLKILDLGVAHTALLGTDTARSGLVAGTVPYMSPEQLHGAWGDVRSDIWSAGAVMFELATGGRAVDALTPGAQERFVRDGEFPDPWVIASRLRPPLASVIAEAMHPQPTGRIQSAKELFTALARISGSRELATGPMGSFAWNDRTH